MGNPKARRLKTSQMKRTLPVPISKELLAILCCPVTKKPVQILAAERLQKLNEAIASGKIKNTDGTFVKEAVAEALITIDDQTIYRIDEGIPVMLSGQGIPANQIV